MVAMPTYRLGLVKWSTAGCQGDLGRDSTLSYRLAGIILTLSTNGET